MAASLDKNKCVGVKNEWKCRVNARINPSFEEPELSTLKNIENLLSNHLQRYKYNTMGTCSSREQSAKQAAKQSDPYLIYGGEKIGDPKDTEDFQYVTFTEVPLFTKEHKSLMAKTLTPVSGILQTK